MIYKEFSKNCPNRVPNNYCKSNKTLCVMNVDNTDWTKEIQKELLKCELYYLYDYLSYEISGFISDFELEIDKRMTKIENIVVFGVFPILVIIFILIILIT